MHRKSVLVRIVRATLEQLQRIIVDTGTASREKAGQAYLQQPLLQPGQLPLQFLSLLARRYFICTGREHADDNCHQRESQIWVSHFGLLLSSDCIQSQHKRCTRIGTLIT